MSFDLAIWRRSPTARTAMLTAVYAVLGDEDHPAAAMFDADEFVRSAASLHGQLPESDAELTWMAVDLSRGDAVAVSLHAWTGASSAEVVVSGPFDALNATIVELLPLVVERGLVLYDPQSETVYNNRRHYPTALNSSS